MGSENEVLKFGICFSLVIGGKCVESMSIGVFLMVTVRSTGVSIWKYVIGSFGCAGVLTGIFGVGFYAVCLW